MPNPINPYVAGKPVSDSPAFIGSAGVGEVALTANEYKTAERLRKNSWLCTVFNCASSPKIHVIHDLVRLDWNPVVKVEHHTIDAQAVLEATG